MHDPFRLKPLALVLLVLATSCGQKPDETAAPPAPSAAPATAVVYAPPSPFSVVLHASAPLSFSGVEGGVWIGDAARTRFAHATGPAELTSEPMPEGLPDGRGKILRVSGKWPNRAWLAYEKQKDDGKAESQPLFWFVKGKFTQVAGNWNPHLALWSQNRMLSMSTSSGKLKVKVMGTGAKAPPDLPGTRLSDASCAGSLRIQQIAALGSGEVFAAGNCRPEGAPSHRYVMIRWALDTAPPSPAPSGSAAPAPPPPASAAVAPAPSAPARPAVIAVVPPSAAPPAETAGQAAPSAIAPLRPGPIVVLPSARARPPVASAAPASSAAPPLPAADTTAPADTAAPAGSAAPPDAAADADQGIPGTVFVFPDVSTNLSHRALYARTAADVFVAAVGTGGKNAPISHVAHFDGSSWNKEPLPTIGHSIRALSGTRDGTLWMVTEREIWKRHPSGAWETIHPPSRAFPDPNPTWEFFDVWAAADGDVWIHARHTGASGEHHVILRLKSPKGIVRWQ